MYHLRDVENVFEVTSGLNQESRSHLNECLLLESSNEDVIAEAEQRLHSIQEERMRLEQRKEEFLKVLCLIK